MSFPAVRPRERSPLYNLTGENRPGWEPSPGRLVLPLDVTTRAGRVWAEHPTGLFLLPREVALELSVRPAEEVADDDPLGERTVFSWRPAGGGGQLEAHPRRISLTPEAYLDLCLRAADGRRR